MILLDIHPLHIFTWEMDAWKHVPEPSWATNKTPGWKENLFYFQRIAISVKKTIFSTFDSRLYTV